LGFIRPTNAPRNLLNSLLFSARSRVQRSNGLKHSRTARLPQGRRAVHAVRAARPLNQNPNIPTTTKASPYQVIAYGRCSLLRLAFDVPERVSPAGGCGLSN